jgi:hypothetical protein
MFGRFEMKSSRQTNFTFRSPRKREKKGKKEEKEEEKGEEENYSNMKSTSLDL